MHAELLHARLVAQNAALRALTAWVDGQDGEASAIFLEDVDAELVDAGGLAGTRDTADAHTDAVATIGQTLVDDLLCLGLMVGVDTLDERYSLRQDGDIALDDTLNHFVY